MSSINAPRAQRRLDLWNTPSASGCGSSCPPQFGLRTRAPEAKAPLRFRYLRLSVTDRCNLRCTYCMPARDVKFLPKSALLDTQELARLVRVLARTGIEKVRITGGEPLLRRDLASLVEHIASFPGIRELALTTNAILLAAQARALAAAGLQRVNISLDSLDPGQFARITRGGRLRDVLAGIDAACHAGLTPVKINVVVMRGWNDHELPAFVELALSRPVEVRFIERMPVGSLSELGSFMSEAEMRELLQGYTLVDLPRDTSPAHPVSVRRGSAQGQIGFVSPMTRPFCASCDRVRLTAQGALRACLFDAAGVDVGALLRAGASDAELTQALERATHLRRVGEVHGAVIDTQAMSQIGG